VTKVLLSNGRALGAEFRYLPPPYRTPSRIFAKRLVVISAGALSTPCILERSGIGNPEVLAAAGISVKCPLKDVGENFQDHHRIAVGYRTDGSYETLTNFAAATGDPAEREAAEKEFQACGTGKLATNYNFFGGKVSPKTSRDFSEVGARNAEFFARHPDKPAVVMGTLSMYLFAAPDLRKELNADVQLERQRLITMGLWTCYPWTTGSVHVLSPDPEAEPRIVTGYLDDDDDVKLLRWGYTATDNVMMGMKGVTGKDPATHPRNGESLERFVRRSVGTSYHFSGTARMGKAEAGGVLSEKLEVHGVEGLMVADLSVCPSNLGADTYHPALLVGEKAADLIAEKLGLDLGIAGK
jgi:alcohol oxidase